MLQSKLIKFLIVVMFALAITYELINIYTATFTAIRTTYDAKKAKEDVDRAKAEACSARLKMIIDSSMPILGGSNESSTYAKQMADFHRECNGTPAASSAPTSVPEQSVDVEGIIKCLEDTNIMRDCARLFSDRAQFTPSQSDRYKKALDARIAKMQEALDRDKPQK
jgi:hypothetical protein